MEDLGDGTVTPCFDGRLELYELAGHGGVWFCLLEPLTFIDHDGAEYTAPAGTLTDFASIPRIAWSIFPKIGKHSRAAVIHDAYCQSHEIASPAVHALFRRMLKACGCNVITQWAMFSAVRLFGPRFTEHEATT